MSPDEIERMIHDRLEGEGEPGERERLKEALERDPRAREQLRRSEVLFEALRTMELEDPPPDLVLGAVAAIAREGRARSRERLNSRLVLAFTFAAGVFVGCLALLGMDQLAFDGTHLPLGGTVPVSRDHSDLDHRRIALRQGEVLLRSRLDGDRVTLLIEARGTVGHRARVEFHPTLSLISFRRETPGTAPEPVTFDHRHLELQAAPDGRYTLTFRSDRTSPPVEVSVEDLPGWVRERVEVNPRSGSRSRPPNER